MPYLHKEYGCAIFSSDYPTILFGGLYNRVTRQIQLKPFTLRECENLFRF